MGTEYLPAANTRLPRAVLMEKDLLQQQQQVCRVDMRPANRISMTPPMYRPWDAFCQSEKEQIKHIN